MIVIPLVNANDEIIGSAEKMLVHEKGLLHRAFSILVKNDQNQYLIHQRALTKYHTPGLWTNTCCGHPNIGETMLDAVHRRLQEEMGFSTELSHLLNFRYRAVFDNGLIENEMDHVYSGVYNGDFIANPSEVEGFQWLSAQEIKDEIQKNPETFTFWFRVLISELETQKNDFWN